MKIFTHLNVDLDAVASVWAARQFIPRARNAQVAFVPADWDGSDMEEGDLAVDIRAGGRGIKGEKGENGIVHSCFASIVEQYASVEDRMAIPELVGFVDIQDAYGSVVKRLLPEVSKEALAFFAATGVNAVLRALQAAHRQNDALVVERMSEIFSGLLQAGHARVRAMREATRAQFVGVGASRVAVVVNNKEYATNGVLFDDYGVRAIVYVDGDNLGLIRRDTESLRMDHSDLRKVVEAAGEADQWFAHPAGFLYCRGSRKAPAKSPSRVNPKDLAEAAVKLLSQ